MHRDPAFTLSESFFFKNRNARKSTKAIKRMMGRTR